jgi:hypothetical protein
MLQLLHPHTFIKDEFPQNLTRKIRSTTLVNANLQYAPPAGEVTHCAPCKQGFGLHEGNPTIGHKNIHI